MTTRLDLLKLLADGRFHSGQQLGRLLADISRTAVWKQIQALQAQGLDIYSVAGKGYRLAEPLELLEREAILAAMSDAGGQLLSELELHAEIDSTNRHLMERLGEGLGHGHACLAERQRAGRGRRGRTWVSPFGRNICLSIYWRFEMEPTALAALGLAVGVGIMRALGRLEVEGAALKWPNDVLWRGRKLAGILLEMNGEAGGPYHVVIGVGMNVSMNPADVTIDQPWVDLKSIVGSGVSRNRVAALLLDELLQVVNQFQHEGLEPFLDEWSRADGVEGKAVEIHLGEERIPGHARGIDPSGAILIETASGLRRFHSGEVSLRMQD
jgi:BirA family biotin operon repressor/biotin-[acetyl-CoA-carboxylase] ligase